MKYQCPFCESFDVRKNELGEVVCFSCFNICSYNDIDTLLWGRVTETPPPFPDTLEKRKSKRSSRGQRSSSASEIIRRII